MLVDRAAHKTTCGMCSTRKYYRNKFNILVPKDKHVYNVISEIHVVNNNSWSELVIDGYKAHGSV